MIIQPTNNIVFHSQLKRLYKKGKIKIDVGIYGEKLTKKNVSDEHVVCKSQGGSDNLSNIVLASKKLNNARSDKPIEQFVTIGMLRRYLLQFKGIKCQGFDGDSYIKNIKNTFEDLTNA